MGQEPLTPKKVGQIARTTLGAETLKVGRGYYLSLTTACTRQIHQQGSPHA
jgi:hypothetical protein